MSRPPKAATLAKVRDLMEGELAAYSVEEIRRYLAHEEPGLDRAYFDREIRPHLTLDRPIDRMGDEPRFLFAAHLARWMLDCGQGETVHGAYREFRKSELEGNNEVALWDRFFLPEDVTRLARMYPFVPTWPGGVKPDAPRTSAATSATHRPDVERDWMEQRVRELADIPLLCRGVEQANQARPLERGKLAGAKLVETAHALADKVGLLQGLISFDGMRGSDMTLLCKHYSASPVVVDVLQRVFGVHARITEGHHEVEQAAKEALEESCAELERRESSDKRLLVHIEGVHIWDDVRRIAHEHPGVTMAAVSHTTSDGRDLQTKTGEDFPVPVVMMSLDPSKSKDERERFRRTLPPLLFKVADAINAPLYERRFSVHGYGEIMGPAAVMALQGLGLDYVVIDPDPKARERALADGVPPERVKASLDSELDRALVCLNCAAVDTVSLEQRNRMAQSNVFINLGSGRAGFSAKAAAEQSQDEAGREQKRIVGKLGHQPIVQYHQPGVYGRHFDIADGYVANLLMPRPTVPVYSAMTNVLVLESLRETNHWAQKGERGLKPLKWVQIETALREKPGRELRFYSRGEEPAQAQLRYRVGGRATTREHMWEDRPDDDLKIVFTEGVLGDLEESIFGARFSS